MFQLIQAPSIIPFHPSSYNTSPGPSTASSNTPSTSSFHLFLPLHPLIFMCNVFLYVSRFRTHFPTACTSTSTAHMSAPAMLLQATPCHKAFPTPCAPLAHTVLLCSCTPLTCSSRLASVSNCFPHRAHTQPTQNPSHLSSKLWGWL